MKHLVAGDGYETSMPVDGIKTYPAGDGNETSNQLNGNLFLKVVAGVIQTGTIVQSNSLRGLILGTYFID